MDVQDFKDEPFLHMKNIHNNKDDPSVTPALTLLGKIKANSMSFSFHLMSTFSLEDRYYAGLASPNPRGCVKYLNHPSLPTLLPTLCT